MRGGSCRIGSRRAIEWEGRRDKTEHVLNDPETLHYLTKIERGSSTFSDVECLSKCCMPLNSK